jgi:putative spermidine/putrescine transport system substrate-binding protein
MPTEGAIVVQSTLNIVHGAPCMAELKDYLNRALSVDYQTKASAAPYFFGPTNSKVVVPEEAKPYMPSTPDGVAKLIHIDWATWDKSRAAIVDRFNKEVSTLVSK